MRQQHGPDAYRVVIRAIKRVEGDRYIQQNLVYGPYSLGSSAKGMRTRELKRLEKQGWQIAWARLEYASEWKLISED